MRTSDYHEGTKASTTDPSIIGMLLPDTVTQPDQASSPEHLFTYHLPLIQQVIGSVGRRHRLYGPDAEEFASTVYLRLIEGNYRILRKFQRRSSMRTFLNVVIQRLYLDFRDSQWGKWRPSAAARRQGPIAVLLERLLDRDGFSFAEAAEILGARDGLNTSREALSDLASHVRVRPQRRTVDDDAILRIPDAGPLPDERVIEAESARQEGVARHALHNALMALDPADRALIDLRFRAGLGVADIARAMQVEQKPLYRRFERLLSDLRRRLEAHATVDPLASRPSSEDCSVRDDTGHLADARKPRRSVKRYRAARRAAGTDCGRRSIVGDQAAMRCGDCAV